MKMKEETRMDNLVKCYTCKRYLPLDSFYKNRYQIQYHNGRDTCCKECRKVFQSKRARYEPIISGTKLCTACGNVLSVVLFCNDPRHKDGLQSHCRSCQAIDNKKSRHKKKSL